MIGQIGQQVKTVYRQYVYGFPYIQEKGPEGPCVTIPLGISFSGVFAFCLRGRGHFQFECLEDVGVTSASDAADHVVVTQVSDCCLDGLAVNANQFAEWGVLNHA